MGCAVIDSSRFGTSEPRDPADVVESCEGQGATAWT